MISLKRHAKLYILIAIEFLWLVLMAASLYGKAACLEFLPKDFVDTTLDRPYITCDDESLHIKYDPSYISYDDEGHVMDDDIFSGKFAIGSGGYDVLIKYDTDALNTYVKVHTDSEISETFTLKEYLIPGTSELKAKMYIPFARSVHDAQIDIAYTGPGDISIYSIRIVKDARYNWVPIVGSLFLFCLIDFFLLVLFGRTWDNIRDYIRSHYELPILAGVILVASLPLFSGTLYWGHDIDFHLARIIAISREIGYGQFPVRMLTDMLHGYGYPTSIFYCDLFLYPFACLYYLGLPLRLCWQVYLFTINVITAVTSYYSFRIISKEKNIALVGVVIYMLSSYRIVDLYLRCAMGEFTAIAFIPIVMLGIWNILYEKKYSAGWRQLSAGMTLLALCHLLTVEMVSVFLLILCLLEYRRFIETYEVLFSILKAAVVTTLLSCWFIFPMLLSMRAIPLKMYENQLYTQAQGGHPSQIFNVLMSGNGFTTPGTYHEMPLSVGGGIIAAYLLLIYVMLKPGTGDRKKQRTAFLLASLALVMSTYLFPWDTVASLTEGRLDFISRLSRMVQFPWRFMEIATAVLALSAAVLLGVLRKFSLSIYRIWTAILIFGTLLSICSFYEPFISESKVIQASDEHYIENEIGLEEYLPSESGMIEDMGTLPVTLSGNAEYSSYVAEKGARYLTVTECTSDTAFALPLWAYPGYRAADVNTDQSFDLSITDDKRVELYIPSGYKGTVKIYYHEPLSWRVFEMISVVSLVSIILFESYRLGLTGFFCRKPQ